MECRYTSTFLPERLLSHVNFLPPPEGAQVKYYAMHKVVIPLIMFFLFGCYVTKVTPISETMNKWMGHSKTELLMRMGPSTSIVNDGSGGEIVSYNWDNNVTIRLPTTLEIYTNRNIGTYAQFYINKEGKIYYWRTNLPDKRERVKKSHS